MATEKTKSRTKAKKGTNKISPTNADEYKAAGYTQVKSGRWIKNIKEYERKVRDGIIDPDTGQRTGKVDRVAAERAKAPKTKAKAKAKPKAARKPRAKKSEETTAVTLSE